MTLKLFKKCCFLLSVCLLCNTVFADDLKDEQVPSQVKAYVAKHYPKANSVEWEFDEDDNLYEAEFKIDNLKVKLKLTTKGVLRSSKEDMEAKNLSDSITMYIRKNHPNYKILGANKYVRDNVTIYDVGIKGKNSFGYTRHNNLYFNEQKKPIKKPIWL